MLPLIWFFVCVILVLGLAYYTTKYVAGRSFVNHKEARMLSVLAQIPLGRDRHAILIRVGERYFLLGSTAAAVNLLAEFSAEEIQTWREKERQMGEDGQSMSFAQSLQEVLKRRGGR